MKRLLLSLIVFAAPLLAQSTKAKKFQAYDLVITDLKAGLAAWQVEIAYDKNALNIVGIEGGEKPFLKPADYDSKGLTEGRIVLAAYTLSEKLKSGELHLARIHVLETEGAFQNVERRIVVLADRKGQQISAKILLKKVNKK